MITRSTSDAFVYDAVTEELVQLTHSPNPATRDDPDISASVQAISANGNRMIVTGELVEFLPPSIIQDEVLLVRNQIFQSGFEWAVEQQGQ